MTSTKRVAVVTGSNKGLGLAIVRALCKQFDGDVVLTSRDVGRGQAAVKQLQQEGLKPEFQQLDVLDSASIRALRDFLNNKYGGLDVLVNNAGLVLRDDDPRPYSEQAAISMDTNFRSIVNVSNALIPLLRPHSRVVNISSLTSGMNFKRCSPELQARIKDPNITLEQVIELMDSFVSGAEDGTLKDKGWPSSSYGVTKIGVRLLSYVLQKQLSSDARPDIIVNSVCPGIMDTDLISHLQHDGKISPDQGALTPVYLCLLPPNTTSPRGEYVTEMKAEPWP